MMSDKDKQGVRQGADPSLLVSTPNGSLSAENHDTGTGVAAPAPSIILGTGSGRCGTKSLAATLKLEHEPGDKWVNPLDVDYDWYQQYGDEAIEEFGGFVDARLSFFMPWAVKTWPDAHWVIVYRYPRRTIYSWLNRGYNEMPDRVEKAAMKWVKHYENILAVDPGDFEYICADDDLQAWENVYPHMHPELDKEDYRLISEICMNTIVDLEDRRIFQDRPLFGKAERPWE